MLTQCPECKTCFIYKNQNSLKTTCIVCKQSFLAHPYKKRLLSKSAPKKPIEKHNDNVRQEALPLPLAENLFNTTEPKVNKPTSNWHSKFNPSWFILIGLCVLFFGSLALKTMTLNLYTLEKNPSLHFIIKTWCGYVGCSFTNPEQSFIPSKLLVTNHPEIDEKLLVQATFSNISKQQLPPPTLNVVFSDINAIDVANNRIYPDDYLTGHLEKVKNVKPSTPIQIAVTIPDPGMNAVNYRLIVEPNTELLLF